jgi:O-antigen/teichoic acid export membrane protein
MKKNFIYKKLQSSEFLRHMLILVTGTGLAQIIPLIASPLISRLYSPEEYGLFALYTSIVAVGATIVTFRYEQVIVLMKTASEAIHMAVLAFSATVACLLLLLLGGLLIGKELFLSLIHAQALAPYFYLILLGIFSAALYQILVYCLNREKKYKHIAFGKIVQMGTLTATQIIMGIKGLDGLGLIIANIISNISISLVLLWGAIKKTAQLPVISLHTLKKLAGEYKKFPFYNVPGDTINALAANLHIILLLSYFGQDIAGIISFASLFFLAPLALLATSFSQVFYQKIATIESRDELLRIYKNGIKHLLPISLLFIFVGWLIPTKAITLLFGSKWENITIYLPILALWFGTQFIGSSLSTIYIRMQKLGLLLSLSIMHIILIYVAIYGGFAYKFSVYHTVLLLCFAKVVMYGAVLSVGYYIIVRHKDAKI